MNSISRRTPNEPAGIGCDPRFAVHAKRHALSALDSDLVDRQDTRSEGSEGLEALAAEQRVAFRDLASLQLLRADVVQDGVPRNIIFGAGSGHV